MTVARSTKRHGLRTEGSNRFERGVDPTLALRAVGRFVHILLESSPQLRWRKDPLDVAGVVPVRPEITIAPGDVERLLGTPIANDRVTSLLRALNFDVREKQHHLYITPPAARLDVRDGVLGRADVIEEVARLYSYRELRRHTPTWPEPGSLNDRQRFRRLLRDTAVGLGWYESWTPSLGSDGDFELLSPGKARVRVTNPLAADESVLRSSMIVGLLHAWAKNLERGEGNVALFEVGVVFEHPNSATSPRLVRGGDGGKEELSLPPETERLTALLGRVGDNAPSAVCSWDVIARRLGLLDVVVRSLNVAPDGFHPTRSASLEDRSTGALLGYVGEVDPALVQDVAGDGVQRVGLIDLNLDVLADASLVLRHSSNVVVPSRYPSALMDLAFIVSNDVNAQDLRYALASCDDLIESVQLFDAYRDDNLGADVRSLAYAVRLSAKDRTLSDDDIARLRDLLLASAKQLGAVLR
jgi:phenylalanyl-tRNA synthetase beta chain